MTDIRSLIRDKGLKATPSRVAVLELFEGECSPKTVEEVLIELASVKKSLRSNKKLKRPDRATLYRILDTFAKAEILKEVYFNDGIVRYEGSLGDFAHHHHHAVCVSCGVTREIEDENMEKAIEKVSRKIKGFAMSEHSLEFFGTCDKCFRVKK